MTHPLAAFKDYKGKENNIYQFENSESQCTSSEAIEHFVCSSFNDTALRSIPLGTIIVVVMG